MKQYIYSIDEFEFYLSDGSNVYAHQIELGDVWDLEIFPPNQSKESFEAGQYSGYIKFFEQPKEVVSFSQPVFKEWSIDEYPDTWNNEIIEEFKKELREQLGRVELRDILEGNKCLTGLEGVN